MVHSFQTLLDALADSAYTGDTADTLLDTVVTVAAGGSEKGWWDDALDACMARVARRADARACRAVYARVFEGRSRGVCARLMEPLLRYSTPSFCEEFLSTVLEHLLSVLGKTPRQAGAHPSLERCCLDHVRALRLLRLAFQQVPKDHIESPKSVLYSKMNIDKPWYLVSAVGKLCVTLRTSVKCPPDADAGMKESYRMFQCENYNALAAAVCCTSLKPAMVGTVFSRAAWDLLIGDEEIQLPLRQPWNQQSTRHALSIEVSGELRARTLATSTMRTQAFAGTLSENVLQYDLAEPEEEVEVQELHLADNALNAHACAATLTALLSRLSAVQAPGWRQELVSALCSARRNVRWLLAQAVCNSKEDLQPHASALRPALLDVIVTTAHQKILNGLHMDILDTLIHWNQTSTEPSEQITKTIDCLVTTATQYRLKKDLYYMVLEKMTRMLTLHTVTIDWDCFETCLADPNSDTAKCHVDILTRIAKCKVLVPQLLPALRHAVRAARAVPDLIALLVHAVAAAVHTGGDGEGEWMQFYRRVLSQLRGVDTGGYIRLLYEAQKSFQNSCDDTHFRWVVDLTPKVTGRARLQCLAVLAAHAEHAQHVRAQHVASMFDTVGIDDLLDKREALLLVKNGLHLMEQHQRRRLVLRVAGACRHLPARERAVAYGALLRAFQLLLTEEPSEPEPKRRARESNSLLLSKRDDYSDTVLAGVAQGLMERDADIANSMREGVGRCLSEDCGVRLCESFLLCVAPPSDLGQPSDVLRPSGGGHLARVVELFFRRVRDQALFQRAGLSDELMLEQVEPTAATRTVAASSVQRGPGKVPSDLGQPSDVLRPSGGGHLARVVELFFRRVRDQAPFQRAGLSDELMLEQVEPTAATRTVAASSVQRGPVTDKSETRASSSVSMDDVLTSVLALLEKDTDAATSVVIQLVASHRAKRPGFDSDATMSRLLLPCLQSATIAPWVISIAREIDIWDSTDLERITAQLMKISRNTEGEGICRLLYEEYRIRRPTPALFVLGMFTDDVDMPEPSTQFSLKNMISCFGSLSNWDDLTSQRRASLRASLPPLWTTGDHFDAAIEDDITNYPTWVKAMVSARRDSERDTFAWLTELQRWPKKPFDISAVSPSHVVSARRDSERDTFAWLTELQRWPKKPFDISAVSPSHVVSARRDSERDTFAWLTELQRWPKKPFDISAVSPSHVVSARRDSERDTFAWLTELQRWPKKPFDISAVSPSHVVSARRDSERDAFAWLTELQRWPKKLFDISAVSPSHVVSARRDSERDAFAWLTELQRWPKKPFDISAVSPSHVVSARRDSERDTFAWLTELQRWPKKPFDISAVMETSTWDRIGVLPAGQSPALPLHIRPSDCLAEWAFRIMMRSSYLQSVSLGSNEALDKLSHSHQLRWCASANERGLHEQALLCCKSVTGLYRSESLSWLRQKLVARRALALAAHDAAGLSKALESAETYTKQFREDSSFDDVMGMNELILRLKRDVQSPREDFNNTFKEITVAPRPPQLSPLAKQHLEAAYVTAITFTNNLWDTCQQHEKSDLLHSMASQLTTFVQLQLGRAGVLLADVIIARLAEDVQPTPNTRHLLDALLELMKHQLDEVSLEQLSASAHKWSDAGAHRRRLSALVQPDYQLQQYCLRSRAALDRHDEAEWSRVWAAMKEAIFDNEFAGADFQVLYKYKDNIDAMADSSAEVRRQLLTSILADLKVSDKSTLYLSHLCPSLARVPQRDEGLARLLCLKKGVYVVRFEEKISVFVRSLRRPALVRCVLSDGSGARFIVKSGERARPHCVALRLLRAAQASGVRRRTGYHVSTLGEECALVQYLEDCVTLRALLGQRDLVPPQRTKDSELILSPQRAAAQFAAACDSVPAYLLRSAIEATCVSVQDFITKRRNFLESLCDMTVLSYLCGIGDRHLENILYNIKDGGACHVDCGAILSFGAGTELPPARLTRNVLAVCDYTALEGRLQCMLTCIRDLRELLVPSIAVAGKWLRDDRLMDKLRHVQALVRGGAVSHRLTALLLSQSDERHRHEYIDLLRLVFADFPLKDTYSVEEQVSSLLRQSTDPLILGVTRSGWEPWI
ncbi:uncharacterized protein LOC112045695 [Bicyclus anynana]|uniref:Uncharacterized protein LOC112045695 n=1 Tax=Bicyclus anynana TaxID=110368 RepID=A0ABM3M2R0_BICAN|nr:uncharacterized protein LOC112045695 [Bicyclus anynana]